MSVPGDGADPRPRPQFGEYATPEEQRIAAGLPPVAAVPPAMPASAVPAAPATAVAPARRGDRIIAIALLAYGLFSVITQGLAYLDLPALMTQTMGRLGIPGEFTNIVQGRIWGTVAALLLVVGWVLTAVVTVRRIRRGALAWWVPLAGAAITFLAVSVCIAIALMGDPAFLAATVPAS